MGLRSAKRAIAKARLRAIGVDRVNRRLNTEAEGVVIWRRVLSDRTAHDEQAKGKKPVKLLKTNKRKVAKVSA